ncbi:MAG: site-specific integrase [Gammaproteobacteria bacterium]|nr:site-specific integrase [Gammaproteobacteria bacterium]MCP5135380.1 site-specific integrase [Gammaproteobacteria bacterium]
MTLWDALNAYRLERLPSAATMRHYQTVIALAERDLEALGHPVGNVASLTRQGVLLWREQVLSRAAIRSWNNYAVHMRALWEFLRKDVVESGIESNPFDRVTLRPPKKLPKSLQLETVQSAIDYLEGPDCALEPGWFWATAIRTLFFTGIRRRQLAGIRVGDVDLRAGAIHLRAEFSKNGEARDIAISDLLLPHLVRLLNRSEIQVCIDDQDEQLFNVTRFTTRFKGDELTPEQISGFFRRLSDHLSIPISAHKLRHTFGTMLAPKTDLRTLQELMGHNDYRSTLEYVHSNEELQRQVIRQLPRV